MDNLPPPPLLVDNRHENEPCKNTRKRKIYVILFSNRPTCLSALNQGSVREKAEVGAEEDDVGDQDDTRVVRDLQNSTT